jgi:hypothetical protein
VSFLTKLLLGSGTLKPELRAALESEGLVLIEEDLPGSLRYRHYRAPGKRFHGKVVAQRIGLGISEKRLVAYGRSGKGKLIDTEFSNPRTKIVEPSLHDDETVDILVDYDQAEDLPKISGQVTIRAGTPNAAAIVDELRKRLGR